MQNRTKIGHFPKQCDIIRLNIKERLDIYQEINNMTGFTVGCKLVETPGLTTEQIAQIEKEQKQWKSRTRTLANMSSSPKIRHIESLKNPSASPVNESIAKKPLMCYNGK